MGTANAEVAAYIGRWRPSSVSPPAAAFARCVVTRTGPEGRERAKNLLWAAGKLADYAASLGLDLVPETVLHPSAAERFTRCAPGLSGVARRTLRTNLRFIGRRVVPQLYPADLPLPRERAKAPYTAAEIGGYLALADAQPTRERRMRAAGLVCLGAGARLIRSDLRDACSSSATSASWQPGTPGRKKTSAAQPRACPRKPASGAARPSPASPPGRPDPPSRRDHEPRARHHQDSSQAKALPDTGKPGKPGPVAAPKTRHPTTRTKRPDRQTQT